jgi:hypothetical protein
MKIFLAIKKCPFFYNVKLTAFINKLNEEIEEAPPPLEEDREDLGEVRLL